MPITTHVVSSNPAHARFTQYNIMWKSLSMICGRSEVFLGTIGFLHQKNWPPRYNWNIIESDVKHHNHSPNCILTKKYHILCDISDEHSVIDYSGLPSDNCEVHQASYSYEDDLHDVSKNMVRTIFVHTFHILLLLLINDFACGI